MRKQAGSAHIHVGENPQQQTGGGGHGGGSRQNKQRPVEHGTHENLPDLRPAVRRKLQCERRRHAAQDGRGEQPRDKEGHSHAEENHACEQQGGDDAARASRREKDGQDGDERRELAVAGDKAVRHGGEQAFTRGIDDAAAHNARRVAAEAHAHGERLFAAGVRLLEGVVEVEGNAGQIAKVLENGEEREKNGHRRQHDGHNPAKNPEHPVYDGSRQPIGRTAGCKERGEPILRRRPERGEQLRGNVCPRDGEPKDEGEQQQHDRDAGQAACKQAVELSVTGKSAAGRGGYAGLRDALRLRDEPSGHQILQQSRVDALSGQHFPCPPRFLTHAVRVWQAVDEGGKTVRPAFLRLKQPQAQPARRGAGLRQCAEAGKQGGGRTFNRGAVEDAGRVGRVAARDLADGPHESIQAAAASGAGCRDRYAELFAQPLEIDADSLALGFVHQVDADDGTRKNFNCLQHQIEVALQTCRVAHNDGGVSSAEAEKVAGGLLLGGVGKKRIRAGNIDENVRLSVKPAGALRRCNRFSRPVSGVLAQAGQGIDDSAFSHIGISAHRNDAHSRFTAVDAQSCIKRGCPGGLHRQPHVRSPLSSGWFRRPAAAAQ